MTRYRLIQTRIFGAAQRRQWISALELLLVCFIIGITVWGFYDTLNDFFIMDDFDMIRGHSSFENFLKHWHTPVGGNTYRPLIDLVFIWDFSWWKWNPLGWHLSNLLFHLLNVFLVYKLGLELTKNLYVGLIAGLLFGLHPGNSEAVIWISARMDVVCTTFILLSLLFFISATAQKRYALFHERKQRKAFILSLLFFACALFIKETAIVLPLLIILYDLIFSTQWKRIKQHDMWEKVRTYLPYVLVFTVYFAIRAMVVSGAHDYGSKSRSLLGGYDVKLAGTFLFGNIEWYFKNLTRPFWEELFSASVLFNIAGIALVTLCCVLLSKISRFAILWIWISLLPVGFLRIHRGVYLVSIGLCLLVGMLLGRGIRLGISDPPPLVGGSQTYFPPLVGGVRGGGSKQLWQKEIRVFQIALIVVLFFRYGIARKDANVRWSNIAEMNEKVPLMIQALYPSFPEGAKICLQNMPTALNQRFNRAFEFQYPDAQAGGIYTRDFEECVQKETIETILAEYFFLYYKDGMIYDFTYETRERLTSQQRIDIRKLPRRPEYKLSAQTPDITFDFDTSARCSAIGIISSLANGIAVSQGTLIAHGEIEGLNGHVETFEIAAGQDTAEWAIRFPGVQPVVQHRMPTVYRSWNLQQPDGTMPVAQNYLKHVTFREPFSPAKVSLKFVASPDIPSNLVLDIDRIVLYTEDPIEEQ